MKRHLNYLLLFLTLFLIGFSIIFFSCLSAPASLQRFNNAYHYLSRHIFFGILPAIVAGFVAYKISLNFLKKWAPLLVLLNIVALFLVFIPGIGSKAGGASRWINLGFFNLQPSEFLKITAILYLSAWIASKLSDHETSGWSDMVKKSYHNIIFIFVPFAVFLAAISIALIFQRDASTLGIIALTLLAIYFSAKTPLWHTLLIVVAGISSLLILVKFEAYRLNRDRKSVV